MFLLNVVILQLVVYITLLHSFLGNGNEGFVLTSVESNLPFK